MKRILTWFKNLFKPRTKYQIVEIEKPRELPEDDTARDSIESLTHHPGFLYLITKLRRTEAVLTSRLKNQPHDTLREVDILQAGIFWARWLDIQVQAEVNRKKASPPKEAYLEEVVAFDEANKAFKILSDD